MRIDVLTLFPEMYPGILNSSILKRALDSGKVSINIYDFREYSKNKHKKVDDYSYGGGAGMLISVEPIVECLKTIPDFSKAYKVITSPQGLPFTQRKAVELSKLDHIVIVCGHYEGIDERILNYVDEEISIGDFILTGGEIASLAIIDSVVRLLPGVLGNVDSIENESFDESLLEYPQYTRPEVYEGYKVPEVLLSGNHEKIRQWRRFKAIEKTFYKRPDLINEEKLSVEDKRYLAMVKRGEKLWKEFA